MYCQYLFAMAATRPAVMVPQSVLARLAEAKAKRKRDLGRGNVTHAKLIQSDFTQADVDAMEHLLANLENCQRIFVREILRSTPIYLPFNERFVRAHNTQKTQTDLRLTYESVGWMQDDVADLYLEVRIVTRDAEDNIVGSEIVPVTTHSYFYVPPDREEKGIYPTSLLWRASVSGGPLARYDREEIDTGTPRAQPPAPGQPEYIVLPLIPPVLGSSAQPQRPALLVLDSQLRYIQDVTQNIAQIYQDGRQLSTKLYEGMEARGMHVLCVCDHVSHTLRQICTR
jgi:hypothetical protein